MAPCMQLAGFEKASSGNEEVLKPLVSGGEWQQFPYFLEGPKYVEWLLGPILREVSTEGQATPVPIPHRTAHISH